MRGVKTLVAGLVLVPSVASAAMSYVPDTGTVARSRGGAFTAAANDPMAIVYNPAGFADQTDMQVYIDITALNLYMKHDREGCADQTDPNTFETTPSPCGPSSNSAAVKVSPNLIFSMPFMAKKLVWHIGAHGAVGVNHKYPATGAQRYAVVEQVPQQLSYTTGISMRPVPWFSFGFTAGGVYTTLEQKVVSTNPYSPGEPRPNEHPEVDVPVELTASDPFTPTAIIGVKFYAEEPGLEVGASYRPAFKTSMAGDYSSPSATEKVHFEINLPAIIRTGFRVKRERWDAELDFTVEDWTTRKADVIKIDDGNYIIYPVEKIVRERNGDVAFRISVGGSYKVSNTLVAHAGILHETAAIPEERYLLTLPDSPKTGIAAGVSYMFGGKYMVSGNLTYLDLAKVDITNSENLQGGIAIEDQYLSVISNGSYDGYYAMMGLSFGARF